MSGLALKLIAENKRTKSSFLDLGKCGLKNVLPTELLECHWLERLSLADYHFDKESKNWIKTTNRGDSNIFLGNELAILEKLRGLKTLYFYQNQISDISFLEKLTGLHTLYLSNNQISDIRCLEKLTGLHTLDLRYNQISDIKPLLPLLTKGLEIDFLDDVLAFQNKIGLRSNPIINPPFEILKQGREAVIEYFAGKRKPLNECKLIFVGDGGVGKTSLMRRLVFNKFDKNELTTHGINKIAWKDLKNNNGDEIKVNLWDFGGQHIQHSLHQFFFSKRVVYVLVLNPRNDQKANYWLEQIEKLGCDSEILVVYNWKDTKDKQAEYLDNFYELRKAYPKLKEPFLLSCSTGDGLEEFRAALRKSILENEGLKTEYREEWFNIKNRLEHEVPIETNYIEYETYQTWCNEEKYTDPNRQKDLLEILDRSGSIVFFDKPILNQLQILNPDWLTTGAYSILTADKTKTNKGHLSWEDLKEIFSDEKEIFADKKIKIKYSERQFQFIIQLLLNYDLCQGNPFKPHEYLIPSTFDGKPNRDYEKEKINARHYRIQFEAPFEMLLIHRFIAKNIVRITGKDYWNSGIFIKHPSSQTFALVETNLYSKQINCWIKGENIRGFWELIRTDFREIFNNYHNFKPKELVEYSSDGRVVFLDYDEMLDALRNGVKIIAYHTEHRIKNIDVLAVLDLFEDKNQIQNTMEKGNKGTNIFIDNRPHFEQKVEQKNENKNSVNLKINVSEMKEFAEIKELLLDLEEFHQQ